MSAGNEALARRFIEEVWNSHDSSRADQFLAANFVLRDPATPGEFQGVDGFKKFYDTYVAAFPDQHYTIEEIIVQGDRVVTRWSVEGTHQGELEGIAPTGRRVRITGINIMRVENGKFVEQSVVWDALGLMQQLGVVQMAARTAS